MFHNKLLFGFLPPDTTKPILGHLSNLEVSALSLTSNAGYFHCQKSLTLRQLLHHVKFANYSAVQAIITKQPMLMFESLNGMSALKYAFKVCDTYMWKLFWQTIEMHIPEQMPRFRQQLLEQHAPISLDRLTQVYYTLLSVIRDPVSSANDINRAWLWHGKQLRYLLLSGELPAHMLKEFCRGGGNWGIFKGFDVNENNPPEVSTVYYCEAKVFVPLFPPARDAGLGFHFSLLRGAAGLRVGWRFDCLAMSSIIWQDYRQTVPGDLESDSQTFLTLNAVRKCELVVLRKTLGCDTVFDEAFFFAKDRFENHLNETLQTLLGIDMIAHLFCSVELIRQSIPSDLAEKYKINLGIFADYPWLATKYPCENADILHRRFDDLRFSVLAFRATREGELLKIQQQCVNLVNEFRSRIVDHAPQISTKMKC